MRPLPKKKITGTSKDGLKILNLEDGEARSRDQKAADDRKLCHKGVRDEFRQKARAEVNTTLPEKEHSGGKGDADAIGRGKYHGGYQIERAICKEEGFIAIEGALHRT